MSDRGDWTGLVKQLWRIRKEQGLSQHTLAYRAGYARETINGFESGANVPSLGTFSDVANAMGYELRLVKRRER